jgi:tellurite resistance-related uncharacterized protein/hemoglobin-like flavoprotein
MVVDRIPPGLLPSSSSPVFTHETAPDALKRQHMLGRGHWGVLHVLRGHLGFVDLESGAERVVSADDTVVIRPQAPHRVFGGKEVQFRIDFFRERDADVERRTPGKFADEAVRQSFERCQQHGNFSEIFYNVFLNASPEIAPYFAATDFERQRTVLRDSVESMVTMDVADPAMRKLLDRLGKAHARDGRDIPPRLYDLWLDSICQTGRILDPDWSDELERKWRVRLRAGMQVIMAAY